MKPIRDISLIKKYKNGKINELSKLYNSSEFINEKIFDRDINDIDDI